ncbi:MAG: zf-HC2 domain-containing protein [Chloroflexi bacterium]|nr:zf-HC2 domain-containing protein [Chloroflexota bacterium]
MLRNRHVKHLLRRYVHGQCRARSQARVVNHIRTCAECRAALAREERVVAELRRELPRFGQPAAHQLATVWAGVWQEVSAPRRTPRNGGAWLPGVSMALVMLLVALIAVPILMQTDPRVEAAPFQPRPNTANTAAPVAGETDEAPVLPLVAVEQVPQATVAYAVRSGATPAPVPNRSASPVAKTGSQR